MQKQSDGRWGFSKRINYNREFVDRKCAKCAEERYLNKTPNSVSLGILLFRAGVFIAQKGNCIEINATKVSKIGNFIKVAYRNRLADVEISDSFLTKRLKCSLQGSNPKPPIFRVYGRVTRYSSGFEACSWLLQIVCPNFLRNS